MKTNERRIVYSINVADIQNVAEEQFERKLTKNELALVEENLGGFIDWHSSILNTINYCEIEQKRYKNK